MDNLIQADIFFFVTTVAVALIALGLSVAIYYAVKILRDVKDISTTVKEESKHLARDIEDLRANARRGMTLAGLVGLFKSASKRARRGKKSDLSE
ncbi:MAG TPA: hypothetical protein VEB60_00125 [Candidatus Paceibacterota bacterium]|nr:hypothetical protein [Candidatus Paceibacterota bacterium]